VLVARKNERSTTNLDSMTHLYEKRESTGKRPPVNTTDAGMRHTNPADPVYAEPGWDVAGGIVRAASELGARVAKSVL
jgi:hypothetical protein